MNYYTEFYLTKFAAAAAATPPPATPAPAPAPAPAPVAKPESGKPTESKSDGLTGKEIAGLTTLGTGTAGLGVMGLNNRGQAHLAAQAAHPHSRANILSSAGAIKPNATLLDSLGIHTARGVNRTLNSLVPGATNAVTAAKKLTPGILAGGVTSTAGQAELERLGLSEVPAAMIANGVGAGIGIPGGWKPRAVAALVGSGVGLAKELGGYGPYWLKKNPPVAPVAPVAPRAKPVAAPVAAPVPAGQSVEELQRDLDAIPTGIYPNRRK